MPISEIRSILGKTLLCNSLNLNVKKWNQKTFSRTFLLKIFLKDNNYLPARIIKARHLEILKR